MHQVAGWQLYQAGNAFVPGVVNLIILVLPILPPLPTMAEPCEEYLHVVVRVPLAESKHVALCPAGFIDQLGGSMPVNIVEHGVVQRHQDAVEQVPFAHDSPCQRLLWPW